MGKSRKSGTFAARVKADDSKYQLFMGCLYFEHYILTVESPSQILKWRHSAKQRAVVREKPHRGAAS